MPVSMKLFINSMRAYNTFIKNYTVYLFIAVLIIGCGRNEKLLDEFIKGFSGGGTYFPHQITGVSIEEKARKFARMIKELNGEWFRMSIPWGEVETWIDPSECLTLNEITNEKVEEYLNDAARTKWKDYDDMIKTLREEGINLIVGIGVGYSGALPYNSSGNGETKRINPDIMNPDNYLAHIYLFTRATVRRYRDYVKIWQIENELNVACETVLWGWREGKMWCDTDFKDTLMETLYRAVKEEDPDALTTHNFHTDIHWIDDIRRWINYLDIIGLDAYPNYLNGRPIGGSSVGERVKIAVSLFQPKPVVVIETGYPSYPPEKEFSEENQAKYIRDAYNSTVENGGMGFLYFTLITSEEGGEGLQVVEPYWGLFRHDGTPKSAWFEIYTLYGESNF